MFPLSDFKPRLNENLENGYLQGRYGAIPFLNPDAFPSGLKESNGKKQARSLKRRRPSREPKPRFLIVCEGKVTEPGYFNALRHEERCLLDMEIVPAVGVPMTVVNRAIERKTAADDKAKKDANERFDKLRSGKRSRELNCAMKLPVSD